MKNKLCAIIKDWYISSSYVKHYIAALIASMLSWFYFFMNLGKAFNSIPSAVENVVSKYPQKSRLIIICEIFFWMMMGYMPFEYISFEFYKKKIRECKEYVSEREHSIFASLMNDREIASICNNKRKTYEFFRVFFKRDQILIDKNTDINVFMDFIKRHRKIYVKHHIVYIYAKSIVDSLMYKPLQPISVHTKSWLWASSWCVVCSEQCVLYRLRICLMAREPL